MAIDGEDTLSDGLVDVVIPDTSTKLKRVVVMSRNLNGKGMGPFVAASKAAANAEVRSPTIDFCNACSRHPCMALLWLVMTTAWLGRRCFLLVIFTSDTPSLTLLAVSF